MDRLRKGWVWVALVALVALGGWIVQRQSLDRSVDSPRPGPEQAAPRELPAEVAAPETLPSDVADGAPAPPSEPPRVQAFRWSATSRDGEIALSGHVPSAAVGDEVRRAAGGAFPGRQLTDELQIASGPPPHLDFTAVAQFAL